MLFKPLVPDNSVNVEKHFISFGIGPNCPKINRPDHETKIAATPSDICRGFVKWSRNIAPADA